MFHIYRDLSPLWGSVYRCCPTLYLLPPFSPLHLSPLLQAVLTSPSLSYKLVTSRSHDRGNLSHDPTCDSSRDPSATHTSHDLAAHDPGKITHDLSRNWSSIRSHDKTCFGHASNPLINTWKIVGMINKTCLPNDQQRHNAIQSTKMRLIGARPQSRYII